MAQNNGFLLYQEEGKWVTKDCVWRTTNVTLKTSETQQTAFVLQTVLFFGGRLSYLMQHTLPQSLNYCERWNLLDYFDNDIY